MVHDEELDELCVFRLEAVRAAETPGLEPAQLRMIAPAALGDVVKDRRDVKQPVALEAGDEAGGQRVFFGELRPGGAPQGGRDGGEVLGDGVDVGYTVLHRAADGPERGQIP